MKLKSKKVKSNRAAKQPMSVDPPSFRMPGDNEDPVLLSMKIPRSVHKRLTELAQRHGVVDFTDVAWSCILRSLYFTPEGPILSYESNRGARCIAVLDLDL